MGKQGKIAALSWARANRLAELTGFRPAACRGYLADQEEMVKELLDDGDNRSPAFRRLVENAKADLSGLTMQAEDTVESPQTDDDTIAMLCGIKKLTDQYGMQRISEGLAGLQKLFD